jgi:hypothetical protein
MKCLGVGSDTYLSNYKISHIDSFCEASIR